MRAASTLLAVAIVAALPAAAAKPSTAPTSAPTKTMPAKKPAKPTVGLTEEAEAGIRQAESLMLAALATPSTLKPHLADRHAITGFALAQGVGKADLARLVDGVLREQQEVAPAPKTPFVPDRCFSTVELKANDAVVMTTEEMVFFEGSGRTATMSWVQVQPDARTLLLGPPIVDDARPDVLERWFERVRADDATMYVKKGGLWQAATAPAKAPPGCDEVLKTAARQVYVAEQSYRAEFDRFTSDLATAGVTVADGITTKVQLASDTAFVVELRLKSGVVTIDDQNALTVIASCTP